MTRGIYTDPVKEAERRTRLSILNQGANNPNFGKKHKPESIILMSEMKKGEKNGMFGKQQSESAKESVRVSKLGKKRSPFTEGHIQKMSMAHKGKKYTPYPESGKEKLRLYTGEKASNWKGGISFEPYCILFNDEFKERCRAFFDYICVECGTPQNGRRLGVHHVEFNKDTCCDDSSHLFIPLCMGCHNKTQRNRQYWQQYFADIINTYYGGKCYLSKQEMTSLQGVLA